MELHNLNPAKGSVKSNKRLGRGQGSGSGGTASRGHKGAKSRSGYSRKRNFEGGQMPLQMRIPKRGFKNPNRQAYVPLNLANIQSIHEKYGLKDINHETLVQNGIINKGDKRRIDFTCDLAPWLKSDCGAQSVKIYDGCGSLLETKRISETNWSGKTKEMKHLDINLFEFESK